jgi:hypothetical protein
MHRRLLLALGLVVVGASLFVGAAVAGSTGSAATEVRKGGTLRLNVSATDYEYLIPRSPTTRSAGRRCTRST